MVLLCKKGRIQWHAKCPFNYIRSKKTVVGTGCTPMGFQWDFKPSMYLSKAILHLGLIRKFIPQSTITSLRQHLWHFSTRIQISFGTCVVMIVKFKLLNKSPSSRCVFLDFTFHFPASAFHLPSVFKSFEKDKKKQGFKQSAL